MFRKMPIVLLVILALLGISYQWLPIGLLSFLYAVSLCLKSLIVFVLPFLIFGLLFKTALGLSKAASKWIVLILGLICVSNFISTMISYGVGTFAYRLDLSLGSIAEQASLEPLMTIVFPKWISNGQAMVAALFLGVLLGKVRPALGEQVSSFFEKITGFLLKGILYIIPLFITGFIVKMIFDGTIGVILGSYSLIFAIVAGSVFIYIFFLYGIANRFQYKAWAKSLKDLFPAVIAGFGSMSSVAAMPLTLLGVEKNAKNPEVSKSIIPMTVNVHLIGDCFAIPIFAFAILKTFAAAEPSGLSYIIFALFFVLAKFSVAAVPGGGILVMLPILETYLGFNAEMLSLITALYILFDPVITSANILGNAGVALGIGNFIKAKDPIATS